MPTAMKTIVWIVSYPKSGNTWVRLLVCNLVHGVQDSAAALNHLVPDIHEMPAAPEPPSSPVLMKTHFPFSTALPMAASTAGAIYVVRDPADVLLSGFHYSKRSSTSDREDRNALDQYVDAYLAARGDPRWIGLQMGTWDDHVRSWLGGPLEFPVLPLRYEDLLREATQGARRICSFLGLARSAEQIERAVAGASFQRMREIEEHDIRTHSVGIFYKPYLKPSIDAGLRFMRSGQSGEAARTLSSEQRSRLQRTFGPTMQQLGYHLDA